jgi:hypothetical protein
LITDNAAPICRDEAAALNCPSNDQDLLDNMINLFLTGTPAGLIKLEAVPACADLLVLADTAHQSKDMARHFYAGPYPARAPNIEHSARHGKPSDFLLMTHTVADAAAGLTGALHQRHGSLL